MCIELYSKSQPIRILFEQEWLEFHTPFNYTARYLMLVQNAGFLPISELQLIYPRYLYETTTDPDHPLRPVDIDGFPSNAVPSGEHELTVKGDLGTLRLADPNLPLSNRRVAGRWYDSAPRFALSKRLLEHPRYADALDGVCERHELSLWEVKLPKPIAPDDSQWVQFKIKLTDVGTALPCSREREPVVFHELASPVDVRRKAVATLQNELRELYGQLATERRPRQRTLLTEERIEPYERILTEFGLNTVRQVDIEYYQLTIEAGDPNSQYMGYCVPQGDIRLRSGSPHVEPHRDKQGQVDYWQPIYHWKSGSILEPAHPWKNTGFTIRFALVCDPAHSPTADRLAAAKYAGEDTPLGRAVCEWAGRRASE